jgi:hypothetical protein
MMADPVACQQPHHDGAIHSPGSLVVDVFHAGIELEFG